MFPNFRKNKREILPRNLPLGLNWSFLSSRSVILLLYRALGFRKATFLFDARDLYTNNNAANRGVSFIASLVNPIRRSIRLAEGHGNTNTSFFPFPFSFFFFPSSFLRFGLFNVHRYRSTFCFKTHDFHMPFRLTSDEVCIAITLRQPPVYSRFG